MKKLLVIIAALLMGLLMSSCSEEKGMSILVIESILPETDPFGDIMTDEGGVMTDTVEISFAALLKNNSMAGVVYADVIIEKLVISYTRIDGGVDVPTSFEFFSTLQVPGGGGATMTGVPVLSATKKLEAPLSDLYILGYEDSTSFSKIRMRINIEVVAKTLEGDPIYASGSISIEVTNWAD